MNALESKDTKSKILDVAARLFASKGFDGTSVRDIAQEAEVNIASVNYHFTSKQSLYWEVHMRAHQWLEGQIARIAADETLSVAELAWKIHEFLDSESAALRNAFSMMISNSTPDPDEAHLKQMEGQKEFGPPGGQYILRAIRRELAEDLPVEGIQWAVRGIFTFLIHWSLIKCTKYCQKVHKEAPELQVDFQKKNLENTVEALLNHLRNHRERW